VTESWRSLGANARVRILFNTHHHTDQTGNNEMFSSAGAKIIAHKRTLEWMSTDHWVQAEESYEKARPKAARPTETFLTIGSVKTGDEQIDYGYLTLAHTNGDIYVFFRNANVLAVGTSPHRCAIRRSIISPERGSAAAWIPWISSSSLRMSKHESCPLMGPPCRKRNSRRSGT
jgi:glyoxylase-like metal-dependent hydrolase (beta-lactamase superfamily II)